MTVETYTARRAYQIASDYRRRRVPVVMGGFHPSLCPDEVARFADTVVRGEAEGLWRNSWTITGVERPRKPTSTFFFASGVERATAPAGHFQRQTVSSAGSGGSWARMHYALRVLRDPKCLSGHPPPTTSGGHNR